jgi:hypothetical protein
MMTQVPSTTLNETFDGRAVLLWRPDSDESDVCPGVEQVAQRLGVEPAAVVAAIRSGELLEGWFVDWEVATAR